MKRSAIIYSVIAAVALSACSGNLRQENRTLRNEIEQRRQALEEKQAAELQAAREDLAHTDSLLTETSRRHDELHEWVMQNSNRLTDQAPEVQRLNTMRIQRDSLTVRCEVLTALIKHILRQQEEQQDK